MKNPTTGRLEPGTSLSTGHEGGGKLNSATQRVYVANARGNDPECNTYGTLMTEYNSHEPRLCYYHKPAPPHEVHDSTLLIFVTFLLHSYAVRCISTHNGIYAREQSEPGKTESSLWHRCIVESLMIPSRPVACGMVGP